MWVETGLIELFCLVVSSWGWLRKIFCVYLFVTGECAAYTGTVWGSITMTGAAIEAEVATL